MIGSPVSHITVTEIASGECDVVLTWIVSIASEARGLASQHVSKILCSWVVRIGSDVKPSLGPSPKGSQLIAALPFFRIDRLQQREDFMRPIGDRRASKQYQIVAVAGDLLHRPCPLGIFTLDVVRLVDDHCVPMASPLRLEDIDGSGATASARGLANVQLVIRRKMILRLIGSPSLDFIVPDTSRGDERRRNDEDTICTFKAFERASALAKSRLVGQESSSNSLDPVNIFTLVFLKWGFTHGSRSGRWRRSDRRRRGD
jgi:hypothetical protein